MRDDAVTSCSGCGKVFDGLADEGAALVQCDRCGESLRALLPRPEADAPRAVLPMGETAGPAEMPVQLSMTLPAAASGRTTPPPLPTTARIATPATQGRPAQVGAAQSIPTPVLPLHASPTEALPGQPSPVQALPGREPLPADLERTAPPFWSSPWAYIAGGAGALVVGSLAIGLYFLQADPSFAVMPGVSIAPPPGPPARVMPSPAPAPTPATMPTLAPMTAGPLMQIAQKPDYQEAIATVIDRNARKTELRLLVPNNTPARPPCVFIAPPSANPLVGGVFTDAQQEAFMPLLARGMAICFYTVDGSLGDPGQASMAALQEAMKAHRASEGGLKNLADAIDTVLSTRLVAPSGLATAGHGSAGTLAILATMKEPRIESAAAFAPIIDLNDHLKDAIPPLDEASLLFAYAQSPINQITLSKSVFIYQSQNDEFVSTQPLRRLQHKPGAQRLSIDLRVGGRHALAVQEGSTFQFSPFARRMQAREPMASRPGDPVAPPPAGQPPRVPAPLPAPLPAPSSALPPATAPAAPPAHLLSAILPFELPPISEMPEQAEKAMPGPAVQNTPLPSDRPFRTLNLAGNGYRLRFVEADAVPGYVRRLNRGSVILKPVAEGIAPQLRILTGSLMTTKIVIDRTGDANRRGGRIGLETLPQGGQILRLTGDPKQNPFLTKDGKALHCRSADRDADQETDEQLYVSKMGDRYLAFHLICRAGDANAMAELRQLAGGFVAASPDDPRPAPPGPPVQPGAPGEPLRDLPNRDLPKRASFEVPPISLMPEQGHASVAKKTVSDFSAPADGPMTSFGIGGRQFGIQFLIAKPPAGYVSRAEAGNLVFLRPLDGKEEKKPVERNIAPQFRVLSAPIARTRLVIDAAGDPRRPGGRIGMEETPDGRAVLRISADAKEVPFLTPGGKAIRCQSADRDLNRETDEVMYVSKAGDDFVAFHLLCAAGDANAMAELEALASIAVGDKPTPP